MVLGSALRCADYIGPVSPSTVIAGVCTHGQGTCNPAHRTAPGCRCAADLRDRGGQPQPDRRRRPQDGRFPARRNRLDPCPARGGRRVRRRGGSPADRPARRLRRVLRPGQPAPDQRAVRREPLRGARPGHRLAHPQQADRQRLLPGNPSGPALQRMLGVLGAGQHGRAGAPRHAQRDPARRRARGSRRRHSSGRYRRSGRNRRDAAARDVPARNPRPGRRERPGARRCHQRGRQGCHLCRGRNAGRPRRSRRPRGSDRRPDRPHAAGQGLHAVRQPVRHRDDRAARLRRRGRGDRGRGPADPARHRFSL